MGARLRSSLALLALGISYSQVVNTVCKTPSRRGAPPAQDRPHTCFGGRRAGARCRTRRNAHRPHRTSKLFTNDVIREPFQREKKTRRRKPACLRLPEDFAVNNEARLGLAWVKSRAKCSCSAAMDPVAPRPPTGKRGASFGHVRARFSEAESQYAELRIPKETGLR